MRLDTSTPHEARVRLIVDGRAVEKVAVSEKLKAQTVLPLIEEIIREHGIALADITHIEVTTGPGSFTGIRVGLSVVNTLATLLHVPVNGKQGLAEPVYSAYNGQKDNRTKERS